MQCRLPAFCRDEDQSVRESLARLIRSMGLGVQVFASAEAFLAGGPGRYPDCLILDIRMPGMNGLELQRALAVSDRDLPVIFITAHGSDEEVRARAMAAGAVDYLLKPLKEDEVLKVRHDRTRYEFMEAVWQTTPATPVVRLDDDPSVREPSGGRSLGGWNVELRVRSGVPG